MTKETIEKHCATIKAELEREIETSQTESVMDKLNNLTALSGLSAELVAQSKLLILERQKPALINAQKANMAASMQRSFVESECAEEVMLYTYADRLNAAITHSLDALRSIISMRKTELEHAI
jgi:hypothetical protein